MQMGSRETGQVGPRIKVYDLSTSFEVDASTPGLRRLRDPEYRVLETLNTGS